MVCKTLMNAVYENEEKLKSGNKPVGLIPCESKIMARRFSFFEAMVREGSNWRESQSSTVTARNLMNQITIKSENSTQDENSQTSIQNPIQSSSIKHVTSLFNPKKLCDFIKSVHSGPEPPKVYDPKMAKNGHFGHFLAHFW